MSTPKPTSTEKHIVDTLIEERAPRLASGPLWPLLEPALKFLLNYSEARAMADTIGPLSGYAALVHVSRLLALNVNARGLEQIPRERRCLITANHPTGVADGVAVYDAVFPIRPDICFFANADARRVCPRFDEVLIPVQMFPERHTLESSKRTLRMAREAFDQDRAVVIFPAGALARRKHGRLVDQRWEHSVISLARKYEVPIIPTHVAGPFSYLFHFFDLFSEELRDITLFHELLNKTEGKYELTFGHPIDANAIDGNVNSVTHRLKDYVELELASSEEAVFA